MKILLADDDNLIRTLVKVSLGTVEGMEIVEACDGDQAWRLLDHQSFDIVLLDWQMPGKTGLELVRAVRDRGSQVPVIMVTAESKRERVIEAIRAGITDYVIKPFNTKLLWSKLSRYCNSPAVANAAKVSADSSPTVLSDRLDAN